MIAKVSAVLLIVGTLVVGQIAEVAAKTNRQSNSGSGNSGGAFSIHAPANPQSNRSTILAPNPQGWQGWTQPDPKRSNCVVYESPNIAGKTAAAHICR